VFFSCADDVKKGGDKSDNEDSYYIHNNSYYSSSSPNYKEVNGNISNLSTNGSFNSSKLDDISPIKNLAKEQLLNSINANTNGTNTTTIIAEIEGEVKKKSKYPIDKTYYIAKEILMTELTYKKDLDVINVVGNREKGFARVDDDAISVVQGRGRQRGTRRVFDFAHFGRPAGSSSRTVGQRSGTEVARLGRKGRAQSCEQSKNCRRFTSAFTASAPGESSSHFVIHHRVTFFSLQIYEEYLDGHILVLERLDAAFKQNSHFEQLYRDFETQKVCYLPLTTFVLKPLHRLLQYQSLLQSKC
jgi:FERM/RhoGEF/pleckstrin domain protein 2